jgi:hypothetical protein
VSDPVWPDRANFRPMGGWLRVTRWVCKKFAQNVAQDIFLSKLMNNCNSMKSGPKISENFKVISQS